MPRRADLPWAQFEAVQPALAAFGLELFRRHGVAFLATTRRDGSPQVHPVCPYVVGGRLYVFVVNLSTKYRDLVRDGRYALHALPGRPEGPAEGCQVGDEFLLSGRAVPVEDRGLADQVKAATGAGGHDFEALFEFAIEKCLATRWRESGQGPLPEHTRWRAG
jgi:hypothetical protein